MYRKVWVRLPPPLLLLQMIDMVVLNALPLHARANLTRSTRAPHHAKKKKREQQTEAHDARKREEK
jgi:hypothetical protein